MCDCVGLKKNCALEANKPSNRQSGNFPVWDVSRTPDFISIIFPHGTVTVNAKSRFMSCLENIIYSTWAHLHTEMTLDRPVTQRDWLIITTSVYRRRIFSKSPAQLLRQLARTWQIAAWPHTVLVWRPNSLNQHYSDDFREAAVIYTAWEYKHINLECQKNGTFATPFTVWYGIMYYTAETKLLMRQRKGSYI